ncbi:RimJ/RimL family protein N-acetyltransferase [Yoonia maricola]|uniref:RimJ/RimL family protein N-acetyltransferase n=1 Tax=Yoonia maricola TaxID=420999 RepID=A0A2M8W031_9RHOB|nr:GNAT family N-acetyltransferase [Yoonia maricola]PJI84285.1 RimJ/RimL family protein N-acetyltransferase [Yoonia maricola]
MTLQHSARTASDQPSIADSRAFARWVDACFAKDPNLSVLDIAADDMPKTRLPGYMMQADGKARIHRSGFLQAPDLWLQHPPMQRQCAGLVAGPDNRDHPLRPPNPDGVVYERYFTDADVTVSFSSVDIDRDLDVFHRWQNDPRVAFFWEEDKSKDALRSFLEDRLSDPHNFSVIGSYDGQQVGYFEIYWAREDRLGAYYDAGPWDRGWHGLIGETAALGRRRTSAWIRALTHYIFLDCPMTDLIVGEPRVDNAKLLRYADALAYRKIKEFDFPHKRSALMHCDRDAFFTKVAL